MTDTTAGSLPTATRSILVPLDLGVEADRALPVAAALGDGTGADVDAVTVSSRGLDPGSDMREARAHARAVGVELRSVRLRYDDDVVAGLLSQAASDQATLCLATHARGPAGDLLFHSVSDDLVRRSPDPVVLVGPNAVLPSGPPERVVVCVDGAATCARIVRTAAGWAHRLGVSAVVVRVTPSGDDTGGGGAVTAESAVRSLAAEGVDATAEVLHGTDAAEAILGVVSGDRPVLVVMGAHGHPGHRHGLGSTAHDVVHASSHPVLVVPPGIA